MKAWEKNVRTVVPYVPGEQPNQIGMIKLNTNENPYPPAPVESTRTSGVAGTSVIMPSHPTKEPCAPHFTTAILQYRDNISVALRGSSPV